MFLETEAIGIRKDKMFMCILSQRWVHNISGIPPVESEVWPLQITLHVKIQISSSALMGKYMPLQKTGCMEEMWNGFYCMTFAIRIIGPCNRNNYLCLHTFPVHMELYIVKILSQRHQKANWLTAPWSAVPNVNVEMRGTETCTTGKGFCLLICCNCRRLDWVLQQITKTQ